MFSWPGSPLPKFNEKLSSRYVMVTAGIRAVHSDDDEMGGVLFLDRPLKEVDSFRYFEVCLEVVWEGEQDGLTIGVTTRLPLEFEECPGCADDVDFSWSLGYDGRAHIHGADDLVLTGWNPKNLQVGDRVGFLLANDGAACVLVNDIRVVNLPGLVPPDLPVYGMIDLLGHAKGVILADAALPPESELGFCLQVVRDEALDAMYAALSSNSRERVKAAVVAARLVGIDEGVICGTERVVRAMPCFQPPPRGPPPPRPGAAESQITAAGTGVARARGAAPQGGGAPPWDVTGIFPDTWHTNSKDSKATQQLKPILEVDGMESPSPEKGFNHRRDDVETMELPPSNEMGFERQQKVDAEQLLTEAWTSGALNRFREALHQAETANVDQCVLAKAQARLRELVMRSEAEQALVDALAMASGLNSLRTALGAARTANVDPSIIANAQLRLNTLESECRQEAEKNLSDVAESGDIEGLKAALSQATAAHVDPSMLKTFQVHLQDLEARFAAEKALTDSLATGDLQSLRVALRQAEIANVEAATISKAQKQLSTLKLECKLQAVQRLTEACAGDNASELRRAVEEAMVANVEAGKISEGHRRLRDLERCDNAEKGLVQAVASGDVNSLRMALSEAKIAGLEPALLAKPNSCLLELERRDEAARTLGDALSTGDIEHLRRCVDEAEAAGVHTDLLSRGQKLLDGLERECEDAWRALEDAMARACDKSPATAKVVASLDAALANPALDRGLVSTSSAITGARELATRLRADLQAAARQASEELQRALCSKDAQRIRDCLETCRSVGAEQSVAEALSVIATMLRADITRTRQTEREERGEMIPGMESLLRILREHLHPDLRKIHNDMQDLKGALRVFCRVRPLLKRELLLSESVAVTSPNQFSVTVTAHRKASTEVQEFSYDAIFMESNSQSDVFAECRSLIQSAFDGYNITIFTYGQTGAGKTWTLYGAPEQPGISPRTCEEVFQVIERGRDKFGFTVSASMVELYNNNVCDLLSLQRFPPKIDVRIGRKEDGVETVRLDCTEAQVFSAAELKSTVERGFRQRKVASTTMNADSSRSHLLFTIRLLITDRATGQSRSGKITIVDLAGSERISKSNVTGDVQKEAIEINKSLSALGDVMSAISSGSKVVPYRNHKLTMLMQDSLGGTAKTLMFVNVSPSCSNADETISALKYASRARCIVNEVTNHHVPLARPCSPIRRNSILGRSYAIGVPRNSSPTLSPRAASPSMHLSPRRVSRMSSSCSALPTATHVSRLQSSPSLSSARFCLREHMQR